MVPGLNLSDGAEVARFCREQGVGLVVVGPEQYLVDGLADELEREGIPTFGPTAAAARLEGSKAFMKDVMKKHGVPTAEYESFSDPAAAKEYIRAKGAPIVVKTSGLAAGKGVLLCESIEEAEKAVDDLMVRLG